MAAPPGSSRIFFGNKVIKDSKVINDFNDFGGIFYWVLLIVCLFIYLVSVRRRIVEMSSR